MSALELLEALEEPEPEPVPEETEDERMEEGFSLLQAAYA